MGGELGVGWPDPTTYGQGDLGGLPKASKPRAPHLRNWGTVRIVVKLQYTLTYKPLGTVPGTSSTQGRAAVINVLDPGSLAERHEFCYRCWRTRYAAIPSPVFSYRWLFSLTVL